ncbi:type III secretion protein (HrpB7) [Roseateles sp. YR242]|uniref:hypothetical protein n=1 Tax=Roseateles sp. YR242 TaxID=1855305 RepID=UPI0008D6EF59|nr:hypothetical protein [Roseateles sp. YR242]SEK24811.1 type III secretion protein (HrpB7) [Roseateles sp. YR242]
MAADLRALKTLLWAKRRRLDGLSAQVQSETARRDAAAGAHQAALTHHEACLMDVAACTDRIDRMVRSPSLVPQDAVTMRHVKDGLEVLAAKAAEGVQAAAVQLAQAQEGLTAAVLALQRAEQQIEQLEDRRRRRLVEMDQEAEDTQDEESEEAAVARRLAQARSAAGPSALDDDREAAVAVAEQGA